jgi:hypothetical protein
MSFWYHQRESDFSLNDAKAKPRNSFMQENQGNQSSESNSRNVRLLGKQTKRHPIIFRSRWSNVVEWKRAGQLTELQRSKFSTTQNNKVGKNEMQKGIKVLVRIWSNLFEPFQTFLNPNKPTWTLPNLVEPNHTYLNLSKPSWTLPNLVETFQN